MRKETKQREVKKKGNGRKRKMRIVTAEDGTFVVEGKPLLSRAVLRDRTPGHRAPGLYALCKVEGKLGKPSWALYYAASATSPPVQIRDNRFREAMRTLLEWHEASCKDCIELGTGWNRCAEGQDLFARI